MLFAMESRSNCKLRKSSQPKKGKETLTLKNLEIISTNSFQSTSEYFLSWGLPKALIWDMMRWQESTITSFHYMCSKNMKISSLERFQQKNKKVKSLRSLMDCVKYTWEHIISTTLQKVTNKMIQDVKDIWSLWKQNL